MILAASESLELREWKLNRNPEFVESGGVLDDWLCWLES